MLNRMLGAFLGALVYFSKSLFFNLFWLTAFLIAVPFFTIYELGLWLSHTAKEDFILLCLSFYLVPVLLCMTEVYFLIRFLSSALYSLIIATYRGSINGFSANWQIFVHGLLDDDLHLTSTNLFSAFESDPNFFSLNTEAPSPSSKLIVEEYDNLAEVLTKEEFANLKKMSTQEQIPFLNRYFLTNSEIKAIKHQITLSNQESFVKTYKRYIGLQKRLQELDKLLVGELPLLEDCDELIGATDIKNPVLLVKQYLEGGIWFAVPFSTNISDEEQFSQLICQKANKSSPKHPLKGEDLLQPNPYEICPTKNRPTRYIWHRYRGYSQELHEAASELRRNLMNNPILTTEDHRSLARQNQNSATQTLLWSRLTFWKKNLTFIHQNKTDPNHSDDARNSFSSPVG